MLVALDKSSERPVNLPDFELPADLAAIRQRARRGDLLCPECKALLWLRAGEKRLPYFAHRQLDDCPQSRVSAPILNARRLLYRFFQERVQAGKIAGPVELEPALPGLPEKARIDLIVHRGEKPALAVMLIEGRLTPGIRDTLPERMSRENFIFRPVFLFSRFKPSERDDETIYLLDTTQRQWAYASLFGSREIAWSEPRTLHFIAETTGEWRTLRGVSLWHPPQGFRAQSTPASPMDRLLWSDKHSDWTHPGEILARPPSQRAATLDWRSVSIAVSGDGVEQTSAGSESAASKGFDCTGCGRRVGSWKEAKAHLQICVCPDCFARGKRLR